MEAAGLPADNLLTQRDSLPESLQLLHRQTLLALGQSGKPPTRHQLETWARELHLDLDGPTVSANCAINALGIAAMLDPLTIEPVTASSRSGY